MVAKPPKVILPYFKRINLYWDKLHFSILRITVIQNSNMFFILFYGWCHFILFFKCFILVFVFKIIWHFFKKMFSEPKRKFFFLGKEGLRVFCIFEKVTIRYVQQRQFFYWNSGNDKLFFKERYLEIWPSRLIFTFLPSKEKAFKEEKTPLILIFVSFQ